jgi:uncharacterized membrane protein
MFSYIIIFLFWFFSLILIIWMLVFYSKEVAQYSKYYEDSNNNMERILINPFSTSGMIKQLLIFFSLCFHIILGILLFL